MALKDIQIPTVEVQVGSGSFAVRALNLTDIEHLIRQHGEDLRDLFKKYAKPETLANLQVNDLLPVLKEVAARAPKLVVDTIALAADADANDAAKIAKLGLGVHLDALGKIFVISLSTEGDMGKALETVIKVLGSINGELGAVLAAKAGQ